MRCGFSSSGCFHLSAAGHGAASSNRLLCKPRVDNRHGKAARAPQLSIAPAAVADSSNALQQDEQLKQQQLDVLLPGLGGGRVPRSEQLKRQELARRKTSASKRRATVNVAKLLTNQIAAASSLDQLHDIVAAHGSSLDHIHVAKLLARTSQLASTPVLEQQQQQQQQRASGSATEGEAKQQQECDQQVQLQHQKQQQQLHLLCTTQTRMMVQRLRHSTAQSLVPAVAALGRLATLKQHTGSAGSSSSSSGVMKPSQQQLEQLAVKTSELVGALSISQLTVVLWGLAKAGIKPSSSKSSSSWLGPVLEAFLAQYHAAHELQEKQQQEQVRQDHQQQQQQPLVDPRLQRPGLPGRQQQQRQRWPELQQVQQQHSLQQQQQVVQQHSLATDLSLALYALAVMGSQPDAAWLGRWQAAVLQQLPNANAQDLSQVLWAVSCLGIRPEGPWLQRVLAATQPLLDSAGSQSLSSMVWAVSRLAPQPPQPWLEAFLQALQDDKSLAASPQAFSTCLAALAKLNAPPDKAWLSSALEASVTQLPACTPWQLTNIAWACASLNARPSAAWTRGFLKAFARLADAGSLSAAQLASVLWSLAVLGRSSEALPASQQLQVLVGLQALAAAANGTGLRQLGPAGRSALAWALASLGVTPSKQWLGRYLSAAFEGGLASDQLRCANALFCIASVDFEYLVEWLGDFLQGGADSAGVSGGLDLSLQKYAALAGVLGALGEMDSRQLRAAWLDASDTEWSPEAAAGDRTLGASLQLPPGLSTWVDSMLTVPTAAAAPPGHTAAAGAAGSTRSGRVSGAG
ncbi:hypothetical protein COO60DRAFT_958686 [Scenedesmus sp. NREL 46B-D3]|nr:hypothetical protein COO60DRAFT_958686 [Scenedesmus sp. NREL 46B-D3]